MKLVIRVWRKIRSIAWRIKTQLYFAVLRLTKRFPKPQDTAVSDKVIYLTFDDGPGPYTTRLLGILNRYHVKATFFVSGRSNYLDLLPTIAAAGHTIGNHTADHRYSVLYSDETTFLIALDNMEQCILEKTGIRTTLLRFPGGSLSIDVYSSQKGMAKKLIALSQQRGYRCVDWDLDSRDSADARTPGTVYRNTINGVKKAEKTIVLMHDTRKYSVDAVESILVWGLKNGYVFLPLE